MAPWVLLGPRNLTCGRETPRAAPARLQRPCKTGTLGLGGIPAAQLGPGKAGASKAVKDTGPHSFPSQRPTLFPADPSRTRGEEPRCPRPCCPAGCRLSPFAAGPPGSAEEAVIQAQRKVAVTFGQSTLGWEGYKLYKNMDMYYLLIMPCAKLDSWTRRIILSRCWCSFR